MTYGLRKKQVWHINPDVTNQLAKSDRINICFNSIILTSLACCEQAALGIVDFEPIASRLTIHMMK